MGIIGAVPSTRLDAEPPLEVFALQAQGSPFAFAEPRDLASRIAATSSRTSAVSSIRSRGAADSRHHPGHRSWSSLSSTFGPSLKSVRHGTADRRVYLWLLGAFAALTVALGTFGRASVMSYVIAARRRS